MMTKPLYKDHPLPLVYEYSSNMASTLSFTLFLYMYYLSFSQNPGEISMRCLHVTTNLSEMNFPKSSGAFTLKL